MSKVIRKRQVVISTLVLALGAAIFLNWYFTSSGNALNNQDALDAAKNLGDSKYVSASTQPYTGASNPSSPFTVPSTGSSQPSQNQSKSAGEYFAQTRLARQQTRDTALEMVDKVLKDTSLSDAVKKEAVQAATKLAETLKLEGDIESLVKAKGFADCVVVINNGKVEVAVPAEGLSNSQTLQIKDIVIKQTKTNPENISVIPVK